MQVCSCCGMLFPDAQMAYLKGDEVFCSKGCLDEYIEEFVENRERDFVNAPPFHPLKVLLERKK